MAILATLTVSAIAAIGQFRRREAESKQAAGSADALDRSLAAWFDGSPSPMDRTYGHVPGREDLSWTVTELSRIEDLEAAVVRVDLRERATGRSVASLEMLWPGDQP
jgi:hypothetical protein